MRYCKLINYLSDVQSSLRDLIDHALPFDGISFLVSTQSSPLPNLFNIEFYGDAILVLALLL